MIKFIIRSKLKLVRKMDEKIITIAKKIKNAGGNLYLVGGAVRDKFLEKESTDEDFCVTGLSSREFQTLFPEAKIRGKSFEVFDLENKEFALARKESKIGKGHKEFQIETAKEINIEQDLARRDLTINSIAIDVLTNKIIDPYHGIQDIENKILKATSKSFREDPLRVYRVARFSASLNFQVDKETIKQIKLEKEELKTLSKERIFSELNKALESSNPSLFFQVLKEAEVLDVHFKEIYDLIGSLQPEKYHPEGDSYNHSMIVLDDISKLTTDTEIRFCGLVHDLGKGVTPKEQYPHHYDHDKTGGKLVENLSERIGIPKNWIKSGKEACKYHMKGGIFEKMTPSKQAKFIEEVDKTRLGLEGLSLVVIADKSRGNLGSVQTTFDKIGKEMLEEISGKNIIKKYPKIKGKEIAEKLHQERIEWLKNYYKINKK